MQILRPRVRTSFSPFLLFSSPPFSIFLFSDLLRSLIIICLSRHEKEKQPRLLVIVIPPPDVSPASARLPATLTGTAPTKKERTPPLTRRCFYQVHRERLFCFSSSSSSFSRLVPVFSFFAISWKVSVGYIYRFLRLDLIYTDKF